VEETWELKNKDLWGISWNIGQKNIHKPSLFVLVLKEGLVSLQNGNF
jgi:hypothetical protein